MNSTTSATTHRLAPLSARGVTLAARCERDAASERYTAERVEHWDQVAVTHPTPSVWTRHYQRRIHEVYRFLVAPGLRVLEVGCGQGDLLAALKPAVGFGVDFSSAMIQQAARKHPHLHFVRGDAHELPLDEPFDVIILSDLVNDLWDVQKVFEELRRLSTPDTRIILNFHSRLWQLPLAIAQKLGLTRPTKTQNWLTLEDVANLLGLTDFEIIRRWEEVLWPVRTPLIDTLCNRYLVKLWPFKHAALTNIVVARPVARASECVSTRVLTHRGSPTVSVIVPARNEAGNIDAIFERVPDMGGGTELIFVEGHSRDDTYAAIERAMAEHPERSCKLLRQTGVGKGDAVRLGFAEASGDILMILDADLTVPPEDLPRFYDALVSRKGEYINGVRLVYPMDQQAMRFLNLLGNKFFSLLFSWLLGQPIKDTLCGTKVLWRSAYQRIAANRHYFGDFDPFGDFDLIFGSAKQNLKLIDMPIRYRQRTYGTTNIQRWRHGWLLLRMGIFAARRIKFF